MTTRPRAERRLTLESANARHRAYEAPPDGYALTGFALPVIAGAISAPPAQRTAAFDVTSVKHNASGETRIRFETPPGRLTAVSVPVRFVIQRAYRVPESRIVGGPSWIATDRFDITATAAADGATPESIRQMLRTLAEASSPDVHALIDAGLVERTEANRVAFPFDTIRVEFTLRAA